MRKMKDTRNTSLAGGIGPAALFALFASVALAACAPGGGGGLLTVRTLEVSVAGADGLALQGGAIDSTWTIPGDDVRQLKRSLALEPGDDSEVPNRLVDRAARGLVTGFDYDPPDDPPVGAAGAEEHSSNGVLEISLRQGIIFRATVVTDYVPDEDLGWLGMAEFGDRLIWIDRTVNPPDTVRLTLDGNYEDARDAEGGRQAILSAQGTLYVATGGDYTVEFTERVETVEVSAEGVARRMDELAGR